MSDTLNEQDLSRAPGSKLLNYDASVVNAFIVKQEWEGLDDYLGKLVATVLKKTPDEVVMMHPGLFMIPRKERLLDMLSDQKFEEAASFFQKSVELLRGCQGRFVALRLTHKIDDLKTIVKTRSMTSIRHNTERIETSISDYIHLYFPSANRQDIDAAEGLWQFAMKLPKPNRHARRHAFRCLACGWICPGSRNISHMRSHIVQSQDCEGCSEVTQDMLGRLKAIDETKVVPTMEIVQYLSKTRKTLSESVSSTPNTQLESSLSGEVSSATGPKSSSSTSVIKDKRARDEPIGDAPSASGEDKNARKESIGAANSPCLGTPAKKIKPQLYQMMQVIRSETVALQQMTTEFVAPEAQVTFLEKLFDLLAVAVDLSFLLNEINC